MISWGWICDCSGLRTRAGGQRAEAAVGLILMMMGRKLLPAGVGVEVGVLACVPVAVGVGVGVWVWVALGVGVEDEVGVTDGDGVPLGGGTGLLTGCLLPPGDGTADVQEWQCSKEHESE